MFRNVLVSILAGAALGNVIVARAGDWPQILGPHRNGHADLEKLATPWPHSGPPVQWRYQIGSGYAGPAVVGQRAIIFHRVGDVERVEALSVDHGRSLWKSDFPATYQGGINPDLGPRCVPLVHDDRIFVVGAAGDVHCLELATGEKCWSRKPHADFAAPDGYFGTGSTPIAVAGKLLMNVGGRNDAGLVALHLETGKTAWATTEEAASYSSPTACRIQGQDCVVFVTRLNVVCVHAKTGEIRFRFPFGKRGPTVNAAAPLLLSDGRLFVTASYGIGAQMARISANPISTVWANDESLSSQYNTPVEHAGYLYGIHGREDIGPAQLRCVDGNTGKVMWSEADFGVAHLILADEKLLLLNVGGELLLGTATPQQYRELARARISDHVTRALPALSRGRFVFRDNTASGGTLTCLKLAGD